MEYFLQNIKTAIEMKFWQQNSALNQSRVLVPENESSEHAACVVIKTSGVSE